MFRKILQTFVLDNDGNKIYFVSTIENWMLNWDETQVFAVENGEINWSDIETSRVASSDTDVESRLNHSKMVAKYLQIAGSAIHPNNIQMIGDDYWHTKLLGG